MDKEFIAVGLLIFSIFAFVGVMSYIASEKKETCIIEGMAQHYNASDIQSICKF